jgi:hypothetical protein
MSRPPRSAKASVFGPGWSARLSGAPGSRAFIGQKEISPALIAATPRGGVHLTEKGSIMIPSIVMIGADKGGVGKTMLARALLDYFDDAKIETRRFDCQSPNGDLKRFATDAEIINIAETTDQMKVFDGADAEKVTVLDLGAGMLSPTLRTLDRAKMLAEVRENRMRLILLHVLGPTISSIAEIEETARRIGGGSAKHFLVKNYINASKFFEWDSEQAQSEWRRMHDFTVNVPQLPEMACETVQKVGGTFAAFARDGQSKLLRGLVRTWLDEVAAEFDRVKLKEVLAG